MWLLDKNENLVEKLNIITAEHEEVLNGSNTLTFECTNEINKYDHVLYKDDKGKWHEMICQRITMSNDTCIVYAEHSSYELYANYIQDRRPTETVSIHLRMLLENTRWEVGNVEIGDTVYCSYYYLSVYESIHKLSELVNGELEFEITVSKNKITSRKVNILHKVGNDLGKRFVYKKDLVGVTRTILDDEVYTALTGRGKGEEIGDGYGRRITFKELNKPDSPKGVEYIVDSQALAEWGIDGKNRFGIVEFDDIEDVEELYAATKKRLEVVSKPQINYEAQVILLNKPQEQVSIGDTVTVIDNSFKAFKVRVKGRITQIIRNLVNPHESIITIGVFLKNNSNEIISSEDFINNFRSRAGVWDRSNAFDKNNELPGSYIKELLKAWNDNINQTGGFTYAEPGMGLVTYDRPIDQNPTKVTQIVGGAMRIANSKLPNGEWDWRTAVTGDGIAGQELLAQSITVNKVTPDFGQSLDISSNSAINMLISKLSDTNYLYNNVGLDGLLGWEFETVPMKFIEVNPFAFPSDLPFINVDNSIMYPVKTNTSAGSGFYIWKDGTIKSAKTLAPKGDKICFRTNLIGKGKLTFKIAQYNQNTLLSTSELFVKDTNDTGVFEGEVVQHQDTSHVVLIIDSTINAYGPNKEAVIFTDTMLTRNYIQEFDYSSAEIFSFIDTQLTLINGEISLKVNKDNIINEINLSTDGTKIQSLQISLEGYTTINNHFKVLENGDVWMSDAYLTNAYVSGTIEAVAGNIGSLSISEGSLRGSDEWKTITITTADRERTREIILGNIIPTKTDWERLDINRDGVIDIGDLVWMTKAINGEIANPITLQSNMTLGGSVSNLSFKQTSDTSTSQMLQGSTKVESSRIATPSFITADLHMQQTTNLDSNVYRLNIFDDGVNPPSLIVKKVTNVRRIAE